LTTKLLTEACGLKCGHLGNKRAYEEAGFFATNSRIVHHDNKIGKDSMAIIENPQISHTTREDMQAVVQRWIEKDVQVVKDPRSGYVLHLWLPVLERNSINVKFIMMVRNPMDILRSFRRSWAGRFKSLTPGQFLDFYEKYYLTAAENLFPKIPHVIISFESLMLNPKMAFQPIEKCLGVQVINPDVFDEVVNMKNWRHRGCEFVDAVYRMSP
jgi:hypothetical protein